MLDEWIRVRRGKHACPMHWQSSSSTMVCDVSRWRKKSSERAILFRSDTATYHSVEIFAKFGVWDCRRNGWL